MRKYFMAALVVAVQTCAVPAFAQVVIGEVGDGRPETCGPTRKAISDPSIKQTEHRWISITNRGDGWVYVGGAGVVVGGGWAIVKGGGSLTLQIKGGAKLHCVAPATTDVSVIEVRG